VGEKSKQPLRTASRHGQVQPGRFAGRVPPVEISRSGLRVELLPIPQSGLVNVTIRVYDPKDEAKIKDYKIPPVLKM